MPKQEGVPQDSGDVKNETENLPIPEEPSKTLEGAVDTQLNFLKQERIAVLKEMENLQEAMKNNQDLEVVKSLSAKYDEYYQQNLGLLNQISNLKKSQGQ